MRKFYCLVALICLFSFRLLSQVPVNDDCSNAVMVVVDGPCVPGTTVNATGPQTVVCGGAADDDVWYRFTATGNAARVTVTPDTSGVFDPLRSTTVEVYSGDCFSQSLLDCGHVEWSSIFTRRISGLTAGNTYLVRTYSTYQYAGDEGKFNICITGAPIPPNSLCNFATLLIPSADTNIALVNGTTLNGRDDQSWCGFYSFGNENVWYKFTATSAFNKIKIRPAKLPANIYATVFGSECGSSFPVVLRCSNDSVISFNDLLPGQEVFIKLNSRTTNINNEFGIGVFTDSLKNDECAEAIEIPVENDAYQNARFFSTFGATQSFPSCDTAVTVQDVWFKFIAAGKPVEIVIDNMNADIETQVYNGTCGALSPLLCQKRDNILLLQNLQAGVVYYLRVYGISSTQPLQFSIKAFIAPSSLQNDLVDTTCLRNNLVVNPGFENYDDCPFQFSRDVFAGTNLLPGWTFPTVGTPDYFNSCATYNASIHSPGNNCTGKQIPHSGKGYAGFFTLVGAAGLGDASDSREYIGGSLSSPMVPGKRYLVSYWVNLADGSEFGINRTGVYFSTQPVVVGTFKVLPLSPQVVSPFSQFFTDKEKWVNVSSFYIPDSAYTNFTIGNFENDANTVTLYAPYTKNGGGDGGCDTYNSSYINIDDVIIAEYDSALCSGPLPLSLLDFKAVKTGATSVRLYWKTAEEINTCNFEVQKSNDGNGYKTIAVVSANKNIGINNYQSSDIHPQTGTNYYRLKMMDCDGTFKYSNIKLVVFEKTNPFTLSPNPFSNPITINSEANNCTYIVFDAMGRIIQRGELQKGSNKINTIPWAKGLYYLSIQSTFAGNTVYKLVKQ